MHILEGELSGAKSVRCINNLTFVSVKDGRRDKSAMSANTSKSIPKAATGLSRSSCPEITDSHICHSDPSGF